MQRARAVLGHAWWRQRHFCRTYQVPSSIIPFSAHPHTHTFTANFTGDTSDATQNVALRETLTAHAEKQTEWSPELVTGQLECFPEKLVISMVSLYGDNGSKLRSASASFAQFLSNRTDLSVSVNEYTSYPDYANYLTVTAADAKATEPSGIFSILASRLVPRTVFDAS
ncbi:hypothetical protein ACN42_g8533 [Penicillium freii]|uniref:Uncharacterized protein n=1 Tax=Penicillium freii TaxID=48697 RepID=A0A101MDW2_PENFR|nr:hypothetical protein ACN42_g8533 [Penicillium freii]